MNILKQKGSATVEFAMLLPLLLLLVFTVSEFGVMFYRFNALTKSVDIAARYLTDVSVNKTNTATDKTKAKNLAVYGTITAGTAILPNLTPANIAITYPVNPADHVQVIATYNANLLLGGTLNAFMQYIGGSVATDFMTLTAASVMRFAQ
jgi:Flp pilus assembly protein TadG